jgi:pterin-4a-carbinolamine dehydratase
MDMLSGKEITAAGLTDWRKLGQGLHARYVIPDFGAGVRFLSAIGEAGDAARHHPEIRMGTGYVDLKLITDNAIYRDDAGTEHGSSGSRNRTLTWPAESARSPPTIRCRRIRSPLLPSSWRSTPRTPLNWRQCGRRC